MVSGCLDCSVWVCHGCSKALQGIIAGKERKIKFRMEVFVIKICSFGIYSSTWVVFSMIRIY